jgi:dTDP-4-dehydrorhamnose reductase
MRILLFGKHGQLGWELNRSLLTLGDLTVLDYPDVDFNRPEQLSGVVRAARPDVVINAVAYTNVDKAESEPDVARRVNADAVAEIARAANEFGAWLIHVSTDYVFDGRKGSLYLESDPTGPLNVYGRTKLAGEEAAALDPRHLILRTSWLYSNRMGGFVNKVLEWAETRSELRIVDDQIGSPTWSRVLADAITMAIPRFAGAPEVAGVYHTAGGGAASRFKWVQEILRCYRREEMRVLPARTAEFPSPAERPAYSALCCEKFERAFGLQLPPWQDALKLMAAG